MKKRSNVKLFDRYSCIFSFLLASLAMFLMLFLTGMAGNGKYVLLRGDLLEQYVGDIRMFARSLAAGEFPFFQYCVSMGFSSVLPTALEVLNPFNILYLLFYNVDVNRITVVVLTLKAGIIAASFNYFMRRVHQSEALSSVAVSVFYAMCGFVVVYGTISFFWMDALYLLPLCVVAVHKAVYENKYQFFIPVFAYSFITQFYMGYLIGIFGLLCYLLVLFTTEKKRNGRQIIKEIGKFCIVSVTAILISGIVWFPVAVFLLKNNASDRTVFSGLQIGWAEILNNLFWGEFQNLKHAPYIYCGIPCLVVCPFYFFNKKIERREKIVYGALPLFFFFGCIVSVLYRFLHGFDAPDSFYYRFAFVISFLLCIIGCRQIPYMKEVRPRNIIWWILCLMGLYMVEERLQKMEIGGLSNNTPYRFLVNFALIGLWAGIYYFYEKKKQIRTFLTIVVLLAVLSETVSNGCICLFSNGVMENNGVTKAEFKEWEREYALAMNEIKSREENSGFYRVNVFGDLIHNADSYWGYNGLSDFCTAENEHLRKTVGNLGFYTYKRSTYATGITPVTEMLLSVKYSGRLYSEYAPSGQFKDPDIVPVQYFLPAGYMANKEILDELPFGGNVFENQNMAVSALSGVDGIFERVSEESVSTKEEGLTFSGENNTFDGYGEMFFIVNDVLKPVYLQIEQESQIMNGIYFGSFENRISPYDTMVSVPFAAKMNEAGDGRRFISLWSDYEFEGTLPVEAVNIYALNEERLEEAYGVLKQEELIVTEYKNGFIKGHVHVSDENKVLMTSVPVSDGWSVKVNGRPVNPSKALNETFMAVEFPEAGDYEIEFSYHNPGMPAGAVLSGIGLIFFAIILFMNRKKQKLNEGV